MISGGRHCGGRQYFCSKRTFSSASKLRLKLKAMLKGVQICWATCRTISFWYNRRNPNCDFTRFPRGTVYTTLSVHFMVKTKRGKIDRDCVLRRTLYIERRIIAGDTFVCTYSCGRGVFLFYEKRRRGILRVPFRYYRVPVSSSYGWLELLCFTRPRRGGVVPRYRDAGEFRLDDFARGEKTRVESCIRPRNSCLLSDV